MNRWLIKAVAVLLVLAVVFAGFSSCKPGEEPVVETDTTVNSESASTESERTDLADKEEITGLDDISQKTADPNGADIPEYSGGNTVRIGVDGGESAADPFLLTDETDTTANELVMVSLLDTDRNGYIVKKGIEGEEISYNDTEYTYNGIASVEIYGSRLVFTLNEDVYFSDGVNLTADDVIFTMYVLADPSYDGESNFGNLPIVGLPDYRGYMQPKWQCIMIDLAEDCNSNVYTDEEKNKFILAFEEAGLIFTQEIVNGCIENFADEYCEAVLGTDVDTLLLNEGLQVAFAQYFWDYSTGFGEDGIWYDSAGNSYDLQENFPTINDFWQLIFSKYGYDSSDEGINYEKMGELDFSEILLSVIKEKYPGLLAATDDAEAMPYIAGIKKTGMYSFEVRLAEVTPDTLKEFCFYVAPLHHYGSREDYKYSENRFGFTKGDISTVRTKSAEPLGAGAYKFMGTDENGDMLFERNTLFYKGCPKIENAVLTYSEDFDIKYKTYEGEGAHSENHIDAETNTYVYIGINAEAVSVGGDAFSQESLSLRNAFKTAFSAYREIAVSQWENEGAKVFDDGSVWSSDIEAVTRNARIEVINYLKSAGFVWDGETEKFTEAPVGADMTYEVMICGNDAANIVLNYAKELFAGIGINLEISVQSTKQSLKNLVHAYEAQMWVMQIDDFTTDDLYALFHSDSENNIFSVSSDELDAKIKFAAEALNEGEIEEIYDEIITQISEYGVIVPIYRRVDAILYSENVVSESITSDITADWHWIRDIHTLEMK